MHIMITLFQSHHINHVPRVSNKSFYQVHTFMVKLLLHKHDSTILNKQIEMDQFLETKDLIDTPKLEI